MTDIPPRCPFCANVLKITPTLWTRLGFKPPKVICANCHTTINHIAPLFAKFDSVGNLTGTIQVITPVA